MGNFRKNITHHTQEVSVANQSKRNFQELFKNLKKFICTRKN